jgi:CMP-N-acetylneuraminic acid synthetase
LGNGLLAVIPARGGSKRIPGKNVLSFFGHPMIAYAIAAARNSGLFERIIVSTDDAEIGKIAAWYGGEYFKRPPKLATDEADLVDVSLNVLQTLAGEGFQPRALCQLMPNCPLRRSDDICNQFREFETSNRKFQISVVPYRAVYPHWAMAQEPDGGKIMFDIDSRANSQTLPKAYCPTGAIWWVQRGEFIEQRTFYGKPYYLANMDANRGIDIDEAADLELADLLVRGLRDRDGVSPLEVISAQPYRDRGVVVDG